MVTLKPTTDEDGASSPVTNTLAVLALEFEFCDEEFDTPQLIPIMLSPSSKANAKNFFIADSEVKVCVKLFPGGAAIFFTVIGNTVFGGMSRNQREVTSAALMPEIWLSAGFCGAYPQSWDEKDFVHVPLCIAAVSVRSGPSSVNSPQAVR
jgi:hypothetical protein